MAIVINAKDAEIVVGKTTMILKHVNSGKLDYNFNLRWNSANNSFETKSYVVDNGFGWRQEPNLPKS
jgi:hypothetical protein